MHLLGFLDSIILYRPVCRAVPLPGPDRLFFFFQFTLQSFEFFQPLLQLFFFLTVIFCHDDTPLTSVSLLL